MTDIIIFATADWAEQYWTNKQRMACQFAEMGFRVLYVESFGLRQPSGNQRDLKRMLKRLLTGLRPAKKVKPNLWVLSPLVIPSWNKPFFAKLNYVILKSRLLLFAGLKQFKTPLFWSYHPFINPLIDFFKPKHVFYHSVDNLLAVPCINKIEFLKQEDIFLKKCKAVFVTSEPLKKSYQKRFNSNVIVSYSPNVADIAHFAKARISDTEIKVIQSIPKPRIVYHGVLSDFKLNILLLIELAKAKPNWQFVFIGQEREGQNSAKMTELSLLSNVHMLGYVSYEKLPDYLAKMDAAILPLQHNDYTEFMFPMKFFEYLAAGLPIVSTAIPALEPYGDLLWLANNQDEFMLALENVLENKKSISLDLLQEQFSWQARMRSVMSVFNEVGVAL